MRFLSTFVSGAALLVGYVNAYANPLACSGVCNNAHDPSVIRRDSDGTYFRFSTGGKVAIHTAPSIEGPWTYKGAMLPSGSKINLAGKDDLWAPEVQKIDGKYYVYYSVSSFGVQNSAIGVASSSTMDVGSWTDHGSTGVSSSSGKPYNAIDANMVQVGSTWYMNFGSFWSDIFQVPMKSATAISGSSTQIAFDPSGTHAVEGAYMMYRSGYYYLFFSHGQCCGFDKSKPAAGQEYKIKVCRSKTATGGFVDKAGTSCTNGGGTIVLESHGNVYGPGGQSVYNDPKNGWILLYHYVDTKVGYADGQKKFGWNKISWSSGWPSV